MSPVPRPVLATAYLMPARSRRVPTTTGREVVFYGGQAKLIDERDLPYVLRREDVTVDVPANRMDWLPGWLNACPEQYPPRARLTFPPGYTLAHDPTQGFYLAERPPFRDEEGNLSLPEQPVGWMFPTEA
jgi:hypothetical protein